MPELGESLMRWSVRAAVLCYFAAVLIRLRARDAAPAIAAARWIFTAGCLLFVLHVALAFHVVHHWSHAHAYEATARRTEELTGMRTGLGLWFNYLFTLLWIVEAAAWWNLCLVGRRARGLRIAIHAYMVFIIFNATAVFETGPIRWLGAAGCAAVVCLALIRWRADRRIGAIPIFTVTL